MRVMKEEFNRFLEEEGINKEFFKEMAGLFQIKDKDEQIINEYRNLLEKQILQVVDKFVDYLFSYDFIKETLKSAGASVEGLKESFKGCFNIIVTKDVDFNHLFTLYQVVNKHIQHNVNIEHFIGAYLKFVSLLAESLKDFIGKEEFFKFTCSLRKFVFFNLSLILKIYQYVMNRKLKEAAKKYEAIVEGSFDGIALVDVETLKIIDVNRKLEELVGLSRDELVGRDVTILHPPGREDYIKKLLTNYKESIKERVYPRLPLYNHKTGEIIPTELSGGIFELEGRRIAIGIFRDIRERLEKEEQLERISKLYRILYLVNEATVKSIDVDSLLEKVLEILIEEGGFVYGFVAEVDEKDPQKIKILKKYGNKEALNEAEVKRVIESIKSGLLVEFEDEKGAVIPIVHRGFVASYLKLKHKNYAIVIVGGDYGELSDEEKVLLSQIGYDVGFAIFSLLRREEIKYLSYFDILTELPNRRYFIEKLENSIEILEETKLREQLAVILIDIDRFKEINTVYGELIGDLLLKEVARRLRKVLRGRDLLARFGNDEFAALAYGIKQQSDVLRIVSRIKHELDRPFTFEDKSIFLSCSIGVALYPNDGKSAEDLIASAISALSEAKRKGGNAVEFFNPSMKKISVKLVNLQAELRRAIKKKEFILYYQPIVDLSEMKIVGAEALIRWKSPTKGLVPPFEFISVLEETGMIIEVGEWVIEEVLKRQKEWRNLDLDVAISLNVSPKQIIKFSLSELILRKIKEFNGDPRKLIVEITESTLMENITLIGSDIDRLASEGVRVEIDDFGTGYSSLAYLKRLPFYALKVDRTFVKDIPDDKDDVAIVKAIVTLAKSLDKKVVAEGVEDEKQLAFLKELGCDYAQGYLFSPPCSC